MFQPSVSISRQSASCAGESIAPHAKTLFVDDEVPNVLLNAIQRRWRRERRRRIVGRAYDMALEIAQVVPPNSRILDVGCGNGFIAHHLSAMLAANVMGIDLDPATEAAITFRQFDGNNFPVADGSVDAVLLCYVLHHAQKLDAVMSELRRVLNAGGRVVVYEDIPEKWWDRIVCWMHDLKWRKRTGACTFRRECEWRTVFNSADFEIVSERQLSRWRNLSHPVCHRFYVLKLNSSHVLPVAN